MTSHGASLIISIKTGEELQYVIFTISLAIVISIGIYEINKKVLKGE